MKKIIFILIMALPVMFTACSDDDDEPKSGKVIYEGYQDFVETTYTPDGNPQHPVVLKGIEWKNNYEVIGVHNGDTINGGQGYDDRYKQYLVLYRDDETGYLKVILSYGMYYEFEYGKPLETRENVYIKVTVR